MEAPMTVYKILVLEDDVVQINNELAERVFYTSEHLMDITKAIDENLACYETREEHDDANGDLEVEDEDDEDNLLFLKDDEEFRDEDDDHERGEN
jgi:hypothetical protein